MKMENRKRNLGLLLVSTLLGAFGQFFFKYAFNVPSSLWLWLFVGLVAYAASTLIYITVLSRSHLSWAYGIGGLAYIFATILAATVLMEDIPLIRWIGVGVIFVGVVLIGLS